jgi:glutamine cyclotransferase
MPSRGKHPPCVPPGAAGGSFRHLLSRDVNPRRLLALALLAALLAMAAACAPARTPQPGELISPLATPSATQPPRPSPSPTPTGVPTPTPTPAVPTESPGSGPVPVYSYRIVHTYPHDPAAWTQGLVYVDGALYESTGQVGRSTLRRVDLVTGEVLQFLAVPEPHYAEGMAVVGDRILQLTWKSQLGFVYDRGSFEGLGTFAYPGEGWGLTFDGRRLIMSDGTATLRFLDPETLAQIGQVEVHDTQGPVANLNELESVRGEVWANVWQTDRIARIDPATGLVTGWIDLFGLLQVEDTAQTPDVLNGIAYDAKGDRLFVTGKLWPALFEIELVPPE